MSKITDPDYFLPEIFALNSFQIFPTGTTKPLLIRGICKTTNEKTDVVVKFINGTRMNVKSSSSELIAGFIAMELGLKVIEPVIVDISNDFVSTMVGKSGYIDAQKSLGLNFGSKYIEGYNEFSKGQILTTRLKKQAENIFSFDLFISNVDRRTEKPNMMSDGENIIIFDHELAFGFIWDIIKNIDPWKIKEKDLRWIQDHYFFSTLKKDTEHNFENFVNKLDCLDENFWNKLYSLIPENWLGNHVDVIKDNLCSFIPNKEEFIFELKKVLS